MFTRAARLFPLAFLALAACNKMDPKECTALRDKSFELINTANMCSNDADCKPSEWPGCAKPVNAANFDKIHGMLDSFNKGKCEEQPKGKCQEPTPKVFCQEGICAFRYKPFEGDLKMEVK